MNIEEHYYSIKELVEKGLGSKATLHRMIKNGRLKKVKFGRSTRIAESEIARYLREQSSTAQ
ncbi:helix-turn-helix domain-containing protein [Basfia succiniciproducens]|uniref:helix-turn-helix domain-containing protein n=1 Tax=Basfia succiniciproducens TaxID=653940 RepID=UPI003FCCD4AC